MRGDALDILQSIPDERGDEFQLLREHLDRWLGDKHMPLLHRTEFKSPRQSAIGTLQEFSPNQSLLVRLGFPTTPEDVLESILADAIADALPYPTKS